VKSLDVWLKLDEKHCCVLAEACFDGEIILGLCLRNRMLESESKLC
jgi:hypothetical protein